MAAAHGIFSADEKTRYIKDMIATYKFKESKVKIYVANGGVHADNVYFVVQLCHVDKQGNFLGCMKVRDEMKKIGYELVYVNCFRLAFKYKPGKWDEFGQSLSELGISIRRILLIWVYRGLIFKYPEDEESCSYGNENLG